MARCEQDREDLIREATGLRERCEWLPRTPASTPGHSDPTSQVANPQPAVDIADSHLAADHAQVHTTDGAQAAKGPVAAVAPPNALWQAEPWVAGWRTGGALSWYLGADPVYHFNSRGELRRAFVDGALWKAEQHRWIRLQRQRTSTEVQLLASELTGDELRTFLERLNDSLEYVQRSIACGDRQLSRVVSDSADLPARLLQWLAELPRPVPLARSPHVA